MVEQPNVFNAAVLGFLAEVDGAQSEGDTAAERARDAS